MTIVENVNKCHKEKFKIFWKSRENVLILTKE